MKFPKTNLNHYQAFLLTYETRSMTKTSKILGVARSAVGQNLSKLSQQLGVKLFIPLPAPRGVEPTSAAHSLYPIIKQAMGNITECETDLEEFNGQSKAIIKMVVSSTFLNHVIRDYIKSFSEKYPNIRFEFYHRAKYENDYLVQEGKVDLIILTEKDCKDYGLNTINLFEEEPIFIASKDFLKENNLKETISLEQLLNLPVICDYNFLLNIAGESKIAEIKPFINVSNSEPVYLFVKNNMGIGYYYNRTFDARKDNLDLVKLTILNLDINKKLKVVCGYRKGNLSKAAKVFADGLQEFCSKFKH